MITIMEEFSHVRGRPSVILFLDESLDTKHLWQLRLLLGEQRFDELDLVIHSGGGDIHVAYQVVELLRYHARCVYACVPFFAKSAATLLCLDMDKIYVDKNAQLGPLDAQIYEEKGGGKGEFTSALNPFKTLEQLQQFSLETLDMAVKMIATRSGMNLDECLKHANGFVQGTTNPLFTQLNPEKLGEYSRALTIGTEYGDRLLRRHNKWKKVKRSRVLEKLVHGYPSHGYIIDYHELKEMGFEVCLSSNDECKLVDEMYSYLSKPMQTMVDLVYNKIASSDESGKEEEHE